MPGSIEDEFLCYVHRYDIDAQINPNFGEGAGPYPDPVSGCYVLKPAYRNGGERMADVIPLRQLQQCVDLVPRFGEEADVRLTQANVLDLPNTAYYLNKYFTRNLFYCLHV